MLLRGDVIKLNAGVDAQQFLQDSGDLPRGH
jgi:hypothetical protein